MENKDYVINGFSLQSIRNSYETKVVEMMKMEIPENLNFDACQICIEDVYALVLSRIPPTYVIPGGVEYRKEVTETDLKEMVRYAMFQVMQKPKHS
ncbi:MAG: late competence development ComFB family protein [Proteobacteria bacterium]|nr:late competence development ComFB family protein [Pseudomonadota bacterium]